MRPRHRSTQPIDVWMYRAREHLERAREQIDDGYSATALWSIMQAILNLERAERKLDHASVVAD